jgi:carboxymethylenebutenolidase
MGISTQEINIQATDGSGSFMAYVAKPEAGTGPAVVVIQEIFGVNKDVRSKVEGWAKKGYVAIAPDLFWRQEPGVQLTDGSEAEWQKAFQLYQGFNVDSGVADLHATIAAVRGHSTGKVGTVGYCLGGLLAYLCATRTDATANVGYYGVGIEGRLAEAGSIKGPLMLHVAVEDKFVDKAAQAKLKDGLATNGHVTILDYEGQDHAFTRLNGQHYDEAAATLANARTEGFFAGALR